MAKQTELKERGTNVTLYPITTVEQVLGTDGKPITDKVLPTKGAEGTILTVKNGAVTWDAPTSGEITSGEITSSDVKMEGTTKTLNQILTPDSLSITEGAINISSSDGNLNFNSVGQVNKSHHEIYSDKNLDITVPGSVKFQCNDIGSNGWGIQSGNGDASFGNIQAAGIMTPILVGNSSGLTIGQPSSTWNVASNGDAKFKDVIAKELTISNGVYSIYVSSSSNAIHTGAQDLNLGLDEITPQVVFKSPAKVSSTISGTNWNVNNSGKATFNEVNGKIVPTSISVPSGTDIIRFDGASNVLQGYYNDPITPTWAISNELGLGQFKSVKATDSFITPAINNTSSTWNIASNGDAKFKDVIADNYKILSNGSIMLDGDDFTIELNQYGTHGQNGHPELYCNDDLSIVTPSNLVIESAKLELISNQTTDSLVFDIVDDEFYRISTTEGVLYIGSETNTNEIAFNQSISLYGEDIYYRSSNTTKSIKAADLDLINYIKGIGSGKALVPESEGSSKLTNTKITLNHYLDIITLNGNYSLMLDSEFVYNLPAIGKHVVFRNYSTETRIITLPNNGAIKSDKETLTVTAKGCAEIDLIAGSTAAILIKSSVL